MDGFVLSRKLEAFLIEIAPHEGEPRYFDERFASSTVEEAWREVELLEELRDLRLVDALGESRERFWGPEGASQRGAAYFPGFVLTHRGREYLANSRKLRALRAVRAVFEVVAFLGGVAAIANLILYVIWR